MDVVPTDLIAKFSRFALVGLFATLLQYGVLVAAVQLGGLAAPAGSALGFTLAALANYLLNHRYTFRSSRPHRSAAFRFAVIAGAGLVFNTSLMELLVSRWQVQYLVAQVAVTGAVLVWNFSGSALWSFAAPLPRATGSAEAGPREA